MVLSNKKLKQKIRAQLTDSYISSSTNAKESFKSLLDSLTQKPRLSKRDKRRVISSSDAQTEIQENGLPLKVVKKRKREVKDDGKKLGLDGLENGAKKKKRDEKDSVEKLGLDGLENGAEKDVKRKMKKKKGKKKKKSEGVEKKGVEVVKGEDRVAEVIKVNQRFV